MSKSLTKSQYAFQTAQSAESIEFMGIFGSNVKARWFQALMSHARPYLFLLALVLAIIKLAIVSYRFAKAANKNITEVGSLGWNILQTALIGTALVGGLLAATTFAIITPALFVTALGLDSLRNGLLGGWNALKWAIAKFSLRRSAPVATSLFKLHQYEALREKYVANLKEHAKGFIIAGIMAAAAAVIFLMPEIGLASVGATAVGVAGFKLTLSAIAGLAASSALAASLIPVIKQVAQSIANFFHRQHTEQSSKKECEKESLLASAPRHSAAAKGKAPSFSIPSAEIDHIVKQEQCMNAFTLHDRGRAMIINHIEDLSLAREALFTMIDEKIALLVADLNKGRTSGYHYFAERERPKREQKLHALLLIKDQLLDGQVDTFTSYKSYFKHLNLSSTPHLSNLKQTLVYIKTHLPGVAKSFFLAKSDTDNILDAAYAYDQRLEAQDPAPSFRPSCS